jgi:hypothetical protein
MMIIEKGRQEKNNRSRKVIFVDAKHLHLWAFMQNALVQL